MWACRGGIILVVPNRRQKHVCINHSMIYSGFCFLLGGRGYLKVDGFWSVVLLCHIRISLHLEHFETQKPSIWKVYKMYLRHTLTQTNTHKRMAVTVIACRGWYQKNNNAAWSYTVCHVFLDGWHSQSIRISISELSYFNEATRAASDLEGRLSTNKDPCLTSKTTLYALRMVANTAAGCQVKWVCEWVSLWVSELVSKWVSEWVSQWVRLCRRRQASDKIIHHPWEPFIQTAK